MHCTHLWSALLHGASAHPHIYHGDRKVIQFKFVVLVIILEFGFPGRVARELFLDLDFHQLLYLFFFFFFFFFFFHFFIFSILSFLFFFSHFCLQFFHFFHFFVFPLFFMF